MIYKKNKQHGFVQVDNAPVQQGELSYRAIGILTYLLSKTDDWETSMTNLENHSPKEGKHAIKSGMDELVAHDYAALIPMRDADSGQMLGTRYVVSDDREWIARVKTASVLIVSSRPESRFAFEEDEEIVKTETPKNPTSGKIRPRENQTQLNKDNLTKERVSKSHSVESKFAGDDWQLKAAYWWMNFLEEEGRLPRTLFKRKSKERVAQEWADTLDKLNRIDGFSPEEISATLGWLKRTRYDANKGQFWLEQAKLTSLASVRKASRSNHDYTKFDMIYASFKKDEPEIKKNNRPERG